MGLKIFACIFALFFLFLGACGFTEKGAPDGFLFGIFRTNIWLNLFYLATGLSGIFSAFLTTKPLKFYFQLIGFIYALLSILGLAYGDKDILGFLASNRPNTWLHIIAAVAALILGYGDKET